MKEIERKEVEMMVQAVIELIQFLSDNFSCKLCLILLIMLDFRKITTVRTHDVFLFVIIIFGTLDDWFVDMSLVLEYTGENNLSALS